MCKLKEYHGTSNTQIDECMRDWIKSLNRYGILHKLSKRKIVACCCGHGKYPMTIVLQTTGGYIFELMSNAVIPRKRNFYKRDKQGYYYIPEVSN